MAPPKVDLAAILAEQAAKKKKVVTPRRAPVKTQTADKSVPKPGDPAPSNAVPPIPKPTTSHASEEGRAQKKARKEVSWEGIEFVDSLGLDMPRDDDPHPFSSI